MSRAAADAAGETRFSSLPGFLLGFSLGGFFDGILLHQILQWHHLLSGIEAARQDIRVLILADGLFHLLMYIVAGLGLWLLWRERNQVLELGAGNRLLSSALLGFAAWHLVDAVLSHWVLGIHRIRMDVENPLLWDLGWLFAFGVLPLLVGWLLGRRSRPASPILSSSPLALALSVVAAGAFASLPPPDEGTVGAVSSGHFSGRSLRRHAVRGRSPGLDRSERTAMGNGHSRQRQPGRPLSARGHPGQQLHTSGRLPWLGEILRSDSANSAPSHLWGGWRADASRVGVPLTSSCAAGPLP